MYSILYAADTQVVLHWRFLPPDSIVLFRLLVLDELPSIEAIG